MARTDVSGLLGDTLDLAADAGVGVLSFNPCLVYGQLAACLIAGRTADDAVRIATVGQAPPVTLSPILSGNALADAVGAGLWALRQPGHVRKVLRALINADPVPGVAAAVGGLLGLRDGSGALPRVEWSSAGRRGPDLDQLAVEVVTACHLAGVPSRSCRRPGLETTP